MDLDTGIVLIGGMEVIGDTPTITVMDGDTLITGALVIGAGVIHIMVIGMVIQVITTAMDTMVI